MNYLSIQEPKLVYVRRISCLYTNRRLHPLHKDEIFIAACLLVILLTDDR
jgi:hypothetical protein